MGAYRLLRKEKASEWIRKNRPFGCGALNKARLGAGAGAGGAALPGSDGSQLLRNCPSNNDGHRVDLPATFICTRNRSINFFRALRRGFPKLSPFRRHVATRRETGASDVIGFQPWVNRVANFFSLKDKRS
ncbi:hypothetical protein ACJJTC_017490 [Scirpophaga incertulas]